MKKKEEKKKKQREENNKKQDEEKEYKEWKEGKKEKIVKDGNEEGYEKSQISGMHKRSKTKDTIKPDLTVSMKTTRIEDRELRCLNNNYFLKRNEQKKDRVQLKKYSKMLMLIMM